MALSSYAIWHWLGPSGGAIQVAVATIPADEYR
jgi:hypothetical protein